MTPLSLPALHASAAAPDPVVSAFSSPPYLLVDAGASAAVIDPALRDWLAAVPAPVIAVGVHDTALARACDVCVSELAAVAPLARQIEAAPLSAAVLVQTLRLGSRLGVADALVAESLAYASLQNGAEFRRWLAGFRAPAAAAAASGPAVIIQRDDARLCLQLNRATTRNAMTVEMRDALVEALTLALADPGISTIEIRAAGRCFSVGGELREFGSAPDPATAHAVRSLALPGRLLQRLAARTTVFVHGACIGSGIEFPAFAGRVIASADAWFQLPELKYGLIPGAGGTVSLARRIGRQRTAWLALSGARIDARTALDWKLVDAIDASVSSGRG